MYPDVRKGIWSEFYGGAAPRVDAYRRNLPRAEEGLFDPAKAPESLDRLRDNSQEGGVGVEPAWIHGRALCVDRRPWIVARTGFT